MIEDLKTGRLLPSEVLPASPDDLVSLGHGWNFDWVVQASQAEVYELIANELPDDILGLMSIERFTTYVEVMLIEPDDVDIVVDGRDSDPDSHRKTVEFIEEYKNRPEFAELSARAKLFLEELRANPKGYVIPDPDALLEQWKLCAEELKRRGANGSPEPAIGLEATEGQ
jgi:hypothetical protein